MVVLSIEYVLSFLVGIAIGFGIGVLIVVLKDRSEKRLLNYLIEDVYNKNETDKLPEISSKAGLSDEEKAKYLRAVLQSIEKHDTEIKKRKTRS